MRPSDYRDMLAPGALQRLEIALKESSLSIAATRLSRSAAESALARARADVESAVAEIPGFLTSLAPVDVPATAPRVARSMAEAARLAGVGPMAAVAGAIAEAVARELAGTAPEVIVENGGDLFCIVREPRLVAIAVGSRAFDMPFALRLSPAQGPIGIASSSGTAGGSLSLGTADLVCVAAVSGALADAVATAAGNRIKGADDVAAAVDLALAIPGVHGCLAIAEGRIALKGALDLVTIG